MRKVLSFFKNWNILKLHTCSLHVIDITPNSGIKSQLRTLCIKTTNVVSLLINDIKISPVNCIQVSPLKNEDFIVVKAVGLFNSKTEKVKVSGAHVETITKPFSKKINLALGARFTAINNLKFTLIKGKVTPLKRKKIMNMRFQKNYKLISNNHSLKTIDTN